MHMKSIEHAGGRGLYDCRLDIVWPELSPHDDASLQLDIGFAALKVFPGTSRHEMAQIVETAGLPPPVQDAVVDCWTIRMAGNCPKMNDHGRVIL